MTPRADLVEVASLRVRYRKDADLVLDGIDLRLPAGTVGCVVGPSGCGKTTLIHAVAGFLRPESGSIRVAGSPVLGPSPDRLVLFQEFSLFPWATAQKNVEFGLRCLGVGREERRTRAREALARVGLDPYRHRFPRELSGGMQRRVALARAVVARPRLLLVDEPLTGLDPGLREDLQIMMRRLVRDAGITMLWVTHDLEEAAFISEHVFVLSGSPARRATRISVDLDGDRSLAIRESSSFTNLLRRLRAEVAPS